MQSRWYARVTPHLPASHNILQTRVKTTPFQLMAQGMCSERSFVECEVAPTYQVTRPQLFLHPPYSSNIVRRSLFFGNIPYR